MAKTYSSALFSFAFIPAFDDKIKDLANNLADHETWDFSDVSTKSYQILKNYLEHTFRKLKSEGKICYTSNNKFACFNTGLVTSNMEEIIVFFEEYKNQRSDHTTPYFFKGFLKNSDNQVLTHFYNNLPEIANYFEKPGELIFNPKCNLIPDIDHIISDNLTRFPPHLQNANDSEIRRQLFGAIDDVKKKVRTNYKIAIPQYYDNKIQLLLPLCLTASSPNPDLALVVHSLNDTTYTARTCLTLKMAYNNARLIVKPQSSWLKP